jgi:hypothetical protein
MIITMPARRIRTIRVSDMEMLPSTNFAMMNPITDRICVVHRIRSSFPEMPKLKWSGDGALKPV